MVKFRGMDGWQRVFLVFFLDNAVWGCQNGIELRFPIIHSASLAVRAEVISTDPTAFFLTNDRAPIKEATR
jgi:hypothetical protein